LNNGPSIFTLQRSIKYSTGKGFTFLNIEKSEISIILNTNIHNGGYFMPESTTWITGKNNYPSLKLLFKEDRSLLNIYSILLRKYDEADYNKYAEDFLLFVKSEVLHTSPHKYFASVLNLGASKSRFIIFELSNTLFR